MKIQLIAISDSDKDFKLLVDEYSKRLWNSVKIHNVKPIKHGTREQIIEKETSLMLEKIHKRQWSKIVLLSKDGVQRTSEQFTRLIVQDPVSFIIGGPYGLDEVRLLPFIHETVSFGKHTMPHWLAKVVLLEQIWRAHCIDTNKSYHY